MMTVTVNLVHLANPLDPQVVQGILADIAEAARNHWIGLAGAAFTSTRRDYIAGIQEVEMEPGRAVISLVGELPNLLENGMPETDMRKTLLGPNVPVAPPGEPGKHQSKNGGFYRAIPFRHSGPTSSGTVAPPMGSAYGSVVPNALALGKQVYGQAKKLAATTSQPGGGVAYGGRLPAGLAPKLKPHHKTDIYAGMIRQEKTYEHATQNSYATFRTISTNNPIGWIRSSTPGEFLAKKVEAFVQKIAPQAFAAYLAAATGGGP
jgi:hypothetical protein